MAAKLPFDEFEHRSIIPITFMCQGEASVQMLLCGAEKWLLF
jgi:hypothetical protein